MNQDRQINVEFIQDNGPYTLDISVNDITAGWISGHPGTSTLQCGVGASNTICSESYNRDTVVRLTANSAAGMSFTGWSGSCNQDAPLAPGANPRLDITITQNMTCQANFITTPPPVVNYQLDVSKITSTGAISNSSILSFSSAASINCGTNCMDDSVAENTIVTLVALPAGGETLLNWSGSCTQGLEASQVLANQIMFVMSSDLSCEASFTPPVNSHTVAVNLQGSGSATVRTFYGDTSGLWTTFNNLSCNSDDTGVCSSAFIENAGAGTFFSMVLYIDSGSTFAGWGAGSCGATRSLFNPVSGIFQEYCDIHLASDRQVVVTVN